MPPKKQVNVHVPRSAAEYKQPAVEFAHQDSVPMRETMMSEALSRLRANIGSLEMVISDLYQRLAHVSRDAEKSMADPAVPEPYRPKMVQEVSDLSDMACLQCAKLQDMLDRLEI